jgi:hypothetical protein
MKASLLRVLIGEELSSVEFIRDYISLHFDGPRIDAFAKVEVVRGAQTWRKGDSGWRDALCSAISQAVSSIDETSEWVVLIFSRDIEIWVGAVPEGDAVEAGLFHAPNGDMIVL